jgi:ubiquitin-conjugating enzyme E2 C
MSNNTAPKRLQKEYLKLQQKQETDVTIVLIKDNLLTWQVTIVGPKKSLYEGGVFKYSFTFPENYPFSPPEVTFL